TAAANTSFSGEYLFAGINSDVMPLKNYLSTAPVSDAKASFDAAFLAHFGFTQADPAVSTITPANMEAFIDGLEARFDGPDWQSDWSNASSQNMQSRISPSETVQSSTNTNAPGMRKLALGLMIGYELLTLDVSEDTRKTVSDASIDRVSQGITGVDAERSRLGVSQARVKEATTSLSAQVAILTNSIQNLESVDTYEAATRVTTLKSQLSLAYTLTSQIQNLSLLNYL